MNNRSGTLVNQIKLLLMVFFCLIQQVQANGSDINLRDAEIGLFIKTVAELTQRNFIVDPRVRGKVTVVSSTPMSAGDIYDVFLSVLDVHGYVALPVGNAIKIVPNVSGRLAGDGSASSTSPDALVTQVISVHQASATELVPLLRPLLPMETHFAALESSNRLIVSTTAHHAARIVSMVKRLDILPTTHSQVIAIKYAKAIELAEVLTKLQQSEAGKALKQLAIIADERSNSLILMQAKPIGPGVLAVIAKLDEPVLVDEGNVEQAIKVVYLEYADAQKLAPIIERVATGQAGAPQGEGAVVSAVSVQADTQLNALIIAAPTPLMKALEKLVAQLDVRRAQVLVEAVIAEISSKHATELGMQWALAGNNVAGMTNFADGNLVNLYANPLSVGSGITVGVGSLLNGSAGMAGILRALTSDADTNIVSTPSLVTLDNEEAEIVVGQNVPFITGQYGSATSSGSTTNATASPFQTIQRENVGVKLKILPKINQGDAISLSIFQEVSSLSAQSISAADVITNTRTINTKVIARDGDLVVLGGLIDDQMVDTEEKVPLLGDLPILGAAFRYKKSNLAKRNLVVFIRPTIVRDDSMLEAISHKKYQYLRAKQILLNQSQSELFEGKEKPLLSGMEVPTVNVLDTQQGNEANDQPAAIDKSNW